MAHYDSITEIQKNIDYIEHVWKINYYHDPKTGRFTTKNGAGVSTAAGAGFKPASSVEEAKEFAKKELGFSMVDYSYSYIDQKEMKQVSGRLDLDTINHVNGTIAEIQARYPELKGAVPNLQMSVHPSRFAETLYSGRDGSMTLAIGARKYKDGVEAVDKAWKGDVEIGYHPAGTDGSAVLWHEYGHIYASKVNLGSATSVRDKLMAVRDKKAETEWRKEAEKKLGLADGELSAKISRYATLGDDELFAEAFAAYNAGVTDNMVNAVMEAAGAGRR